MMPRRVYNSLVNNQYLYRLKSAFKATKKAGIANIGITDSVEAIEALCYPELAHLNLSRNRLMGSRSIIEMVNIAYHFGCKNIMEIGAGLSTAFWAAYARSTGACVCTIDIDFGPMQDFFRNTQHETLIAEQINLVKGSTITASDYLDFYNCDGKKEIAGINISDFADYLDLFRRLDFSSQETRAVRALAARQKWSIRNLIVDKSRLVLPRPLVDIYSRERNFDNEVKFFKEIENHVATGVLDNLTSSQGSNWDFVFFDGGELSSVMEWIKLKDRIAVGGMAAFHDIFFPKSFKNFIVCASLLADPGWTVVFVDDTTNQGLLMARRLQ